MKLSQYKEKKNHRKLAFVIVAIIFLIGGIILDKTFASFKENKSFKVMEGNFIYEGSGDIIFAFYHGKESLTKMPGKENDDNLIFDKGECDKGASIQWSDELWAPTVMNLQESKTTCMLYFKKIYDPICNSAGDNSGACYLAKKGENDKTNLIYDNTKDNNIRFVGATPDNYVKFNNETWRIIGVMDNIEDESGNIGSHIKIIRDSIGEYSWDTSETSINGGLGINEWSTSAITKVLNENYYHKEPGGTCYKNKNFSKKDCPNWEEIGLNDEARSMVSKVKWNTGTLKYSIDSIFLATNVYEMERSENAIKNCLSTVDACNDEIIRTTSWPGYVGLMYISDYGYAIGGENRQSCLENAMNNLDQEPYKTNCPSNSWLYDGTNGQWLMSPYYQSNNGSSVSFLYPAGALGTRNAFNASVVRPVVYLNSSIKIEADSSEDYGSSTNPFRLVA